MTRNPSLPTRIISTLLAVTLMHSSTGSAWATGAKAISGRATGNVVTGLGVVGINGINTVGPGLKIESPALGGTLPMLAVPTFGSMERAAPIVIHRRDAVVPKASVPRFAVSEKKTPRSIVASQLQRKTVAIQTDLRAAADLGSVSVENAHGTGISLAAKIFGISPNRRGSGSLVNAADSGMMSKKLVFAADWIDPAQAYVSVRAAARTSMPSPSVSYADADLEIIDGVIRVSAVRYSLVDTLVESAGQFSLEYKAGAKAAEGRFYNLGRIYSYKSTGGMLLNSLEPGIPLKKALTRLHRARPDFKPTRVALYQPTSMPSSEKGLVYRFVDGHGMVLEIDAKTGRYNGNPIVDEDVLVQQLVSPVVPPPVDASSMIEMPVIERSDSRSLWVGGAALATAYAAVTFFISSIFAWPLVGAAFVVFFITGLAGVITYMSALSTRYSKFGTDTWVNDPARARAGTIMLNAGFLSGVFAVALAVFAPAATAVGLLAFTGMVRRDFMVSPATLYERAFYEAKQHADGPLHFGEATISSPVHDGDHWKFNFFSIPEGDGAKAKMISIDFHKGGGLVSIDGFHSKAYTYKDVPLPADQPVFPITPEVFKSAVQMTPEEALTEVQRVAAIRGGVSISLRAEVQGEKGAHGDFKYRFYDNSGYEVAVNARSREVRVLKEPRVETREERLERFKAWKSLRDLDVWLGEHLPLYTFLKWAAIIGAGIFLIDMFFNIPAMIGAVGAIGVLGAGGYLVRRDSMPKPVDLYTRALEEAKEASGGMPVKFVRATASYPLTDQKWIYTFHADHPKLADKMRMIDISFANGMLVIAGNFETQQHVYTLGGDLSQFGEGRVMDVDAFSTIARITPDEALAAAKQRIPAFLTVRSSIELTANGGSAGMSYRIYDEKGNVAAVDAVNGEVFEAVEAEVTPPTGIVDWFFSLIK